MLKKLAAILTIVITSTLLSSAFAASFQSMEQSAANLGAADAGTGTNTNDAAIEFYNPAGMPLVGHKVVSVSGIGVLANIKMYDTYATDHASPTPQQITGRTKGPVSRGFMPAFHYIQPITRKLAWGAGITVPYGLETLYPSDSITRYAATSSIIKTLNFGIGLGYRITDKFSIGAAFDTQYLYAELDRAIDANSITGGVINHDLKATERGSSWGIGYNLGILYQITPSTRLGVAYRSKIKHYLTGTSDISGFRNGNEIIVAGNAGIADGDVNANITIPASLTFSAQHNIDKCWTIRADAAYTFWNVLKKITMHLSADPNDPQTIILHYHNAWRFAIGETYKLNNKWTLRNGFAYDMTPTDGTYKTVRIPDGNRYWITLGANYRWTPAFTIDVGYGLILFHNSHINRSIIAPGPGLSNAIMRAKYRAYANLIGLQLNYHFSS